MQETFQLQEHPVADKHAQRVAQAAAAPLAAEESKPALVIRDPSTGMYFRKIADRNSSVLWTKSPALAYQMPDQGIVDFWMPQIKKLEPGDYVTEENSA